MGQFKPMVKMMTTEPTVELKLKKGGKVEKKMQKGGMSAPMTGGLPARGGDMAAAAPGRPDMKRRLRMMKAMGSGPSAPVGQAARMMKEGGESKSEHSAEMKKMAATAKELKEHKSMPASKGHKGLKTGGVVMGQGGFKTGGVVNGQGGYKHGGKAKKMAMGGGTSGQSLPPPPNPAPLVSRPPESPTAPKTTPKPQIDYMSKAIPGGSERVKMGRLYNPALSGAAKTTSGGSSNRLFKNPATKMASGGKTKKYAKGGGVEGNVSTTPAGVSNTKTGEVVKGQGGYKKGGATKKYARGGAVNDSGKAVEMPQGHKKPPTPVSISRLSGTYKKGGSVKMMEGGPADVAAEKKRKAMDKAYEESSRVSSEVEEAMNPLSMLKEGFGKVKKMFKGEPSGESVTKTKESVTVTPVKKRYGGAC